MRGFPHVPAVDENITDAKFEVVGGPYRVGEAHRTRRGWYFTGRYDADGDALFMRHPSWWKRRAIFRRIGGWPGAVLGLLYLAAALATAFGIGAAALRYFAGDHRSAPFSSEDTADAPGP